MNQIITKNGKIFDTDLVSIISNPNRMYINIINSSLSSIAVVFENFDETSELHYNDQVYTGYYLIGIIKENNSYRVNLAK